MQNIIKINKKKCSKKAWLFSAVGNTKQAKVICTQPKRI